MFELDGINGSSDLFILDDVDVRELNLFNNVGQNLPLSISRIEALINDENVL